jgi:hypothetical protein
MVKIKIKTTENYLSTPCIICGEDVELNMTEEMSSRCGNYIFKVCDECKEAVMKMREMK